MLFISDHHTIRNFSQGGESSVDSGPGSPVGVLPLQFPASQNTHSLGLSGEETFTIEGVTSRN